MPPHALTNFEIHKYYQNDAQLSSKNEPKFNGVCPGNNLPEIKDRAYVTNLWWVRINRNSLDSSLSEW